MYSFDSESFQLRRGSSNRLDPVQKIWSRWKGGVVPTEIGQYWQRLSSTFLTPLNPPSKPQTEGSFHHENYTWFCNRGTNYVITKTQTDRDGIPGLSWSKDRRFRRLVWGSGSLSRVHWGSGRHCNQRCTVVWYCSTLWIGSFYSVLTSSFVFSVEYL